METIGAIFRWVVGLFFGLILFFVMVLTIPLSIFSSQLLEREKATKWIVALTENQTVMENSIEGMLKALSEVNHEDPAVTKLFKEAADKNSQVGKAVREVVTPEMLRGNLNTAAQEFYLWLDGQKSTLSFSILLGTSKSTRTELIASLLSARYANLPECTAEQKKDYDKGPKTDFAEIPCNIGNVPTSRFLVASRNLLTEPDVQKFFDEGIPVNPNVSIETRQGLLTLKRFASLGIILAWLAAAILVLLMILLFVPEGVNMIMTGLIVGFTGLTLSLFGGGSFVLFQNIVPKGEIVGSIGQAFAGTLGKPILLHGLALSMLAVLLIGIGIWLLVKNKGTKSIPLASNTVEKAKN